jgi:hypothetical protein
MITYVLESFVAFARQVVVSTFPSKLLFSLFPEKVVICIGTLYHVGIFMAAVMSAQWVALYVMVVTFQKVSSFDFFSYEVWRNWLDFDPSMLIKGVDKLNDKATLDQLNPKSALYPLLDGGHWKPSSFDPSEGIDILEEQYNQKHTSPLTEQNPVDSTSSRDATDRTAAWRLLFIFSLAITAVVIADVFGR